MNYKKYSPLLFIGLISIIINFFLHWVGAFSLIETKLYDYRFRLRGPLTQFKESPPDVVIVEIDDESYRLIPESYPYSRGRVWSTVIRNLTDAKAKVIVFDIMFDAPDHTSKILENHLTKDCANCAYVDGDEQFLQALRYANQNGTKIVLASKMTNDVNRVPAQYIIYPNENILDNTIKTGLVNVVADDIDYVFKRYPIFYKIESNPNDLYLTIAVQSVLSFYDIELKKIKQNVEKQLFQINELSINTYNKEASFLINYYGATSSIFNTFKNYSLYEVIDNHNFNLSSFDEDDDWIDKYINPDNLNYSRFGIEKSPFKDKIVIIGSSLEEDNDFILTPYYNFNGKNALMPGVEMHANAIQQIIDQDYLKVPTSSLKLTDKTVLYQLSVLFFLVLIGLIVSNRKSLLASVSFMLIIIISWFSFSMGSFVNDQLWLFKVIFNSLFSSNISFNHLNIGESILLPVFYPIASLLITFGVNLSYKLLSEQKNKKFLKETFGKYVSPELIEEMYVNKKNPELGGESGVRTAFFSDIQSFSSIAEKMSSSELVELLNEFLSSQTEIIINHKGTLDKYEGDAILAFFGAPVFFKDHATAALDSGIALHENLDFLTKKWSGEGTKWPLLAQNMKMRIGINSGEMVTGNMGSKHHMNYTMMGDVVNIAARLESSAKQYGIYFHTTENTLMAAGEKKYCWRYIDRVQFVGKSVWHQTVEILGYKKGISNKKNKLIEHFNNGLQLYYNQQWDDAIKEFSISINYETNNEEKDINPSKIFIKRAEEFKIFPPRKGWRGAFVLNDK